MEIDWDDMAKVMGYPYEKAMFDDMYTKQRLSIGDLAKRLGVGTTTVKRRIEGCYIELRQRGGSNNMGKQSRKIHHLDQRVVLFAELNELSDRTGISRSLLYKYRRARLKHDEVLHNKSDQGAEEVQQPESVPLGVATDKERGLPSILPREEGEG